MARMDANTFPSYLSSTNNFPLGIEVASAERNYIIDKQGKRYLDFISGIGVNNIGHGHPEIIRAIREQSEKYTHTMVYGEFIQEPQNLLALHLTEHLPKSLNCVYFVNSGTEAVEAAMKLAKKVTRRTNIVAFKGGYHGNTQGSMSVSWNEDKKNPFRPLLPGVSFIRLNEVDDLDVIDESVAAVFLETIQGDAGVHIPDESYIKKLRQRCKEKGVLLVLDEIQCGMGRTGKLFAFEHFEIEPDILVIGKALGGGLPLAAFITSTERMTYIRENPALGHITTFGGNPVCCAAGLAHLKVLTEGNLVKEAEAKGQKIAESLNILDEVLEVRYKGLLVAVDLSSAELVNELVLRLIEKGLITFWFLSCPSSFRLAPPLTITDEEIEQACKLIKETILEIS